MTIVALACMVLGNVSEMRQIILVLAGAMDVPDLMLAHKGLQMKTALPNGPFRRSTLPS